jgi:hypothetical protein
MSQGTGEKGGGFPGPGERVFEAGEVTFPAERRERRLEELRREAEATGRVEGAGVRAEGGPFPQATAESGYYGRPLLKAPAWTWEVPLYFFTGGAAGAAAVVAAAARLAGGDRELARDARWLAALGGAASAPLLIADLGRPERFLNMLRVFKPQSPMSVGSWTLTAFASAAGAAAFADLLERRYGGGVPVRVLGDAAELVAAATGTVMATYTGVLIGATVVPVWNRNVAELPAHFAVSGLASAVGLLELAGNRHRALNALGVAAAAAETAIAVGHEIAAEPADSPLREGASGALVRAAGLLSGPLALGLRLLGARRAAALSALAGSLLTRYGWLAAGRASARDPAIPLGLENGR